MNMHESFPQTDASYKHDASEVVCVYMQDANVTLLALSDRRRRVKAFSC